MYNCFLNVKINNLVNTQLNVHFQINLSFISANFCKMWCNRMIVHVLDYNFLLWVFHTFLHFSKYLHNCVFLSFYVVKWPFLIANISKKCKKVQAKLKFFEFTCIVLFKKCIHSFNNIQSFLYYEVKNLQIFTLFPYENI